ncbi:MAG: hypothetical protein JRH03_05025, partial [Deltaproteobacteria bacterium]|nr:hypothetical protein [Deltaproteobacteria bacterium]
MNIFQHVERAATFFPEKDAILFEGSSISYGKLKSDVIRLTHALKSKGI